MNTVRLECRRLISSQFESVQLLSNLKQRLKTLITAFTVDRTDVTVDSSLITADKTTI